MMKTKKTSYGDYWEQSNIEMFRHGDFILQLRFYLGREARRASMHPFNAIVLGIEQINATKAL